MTIYLNLTSSQIPSCIELMNFQARARIKSTAEAKRLIAAKIMNTEGLQLFAAGLIHRPQGSLWKPIRGQSFGIAEIIELTSIQAIRLIENPKHKIQ